MKTTLEQEDIQAITGGLTRVWERGHNMGIHLYKLNTGKALQGRIGFTIL